MSHTPATPPATPARERKTVSFVIPAHNEEGYVAACVRGAFSCVSHDVRQVIVVNNASTDGTGNVLRGLRREFGDALTVIDLPEKGIALARQAGLDAATSEYVASVDADCRPNDRWLSTMMGIILSSPGVVCASGPYRYYDLPAVYAPLYVARELFLSTVGRLAPYADSQVCGGNFIAKRSALLSAGGFDTSILFYGEDVETERRLRGVGKVVFSRRAAIPSSARRILAEGLVRSFFLTRFNRYYQLLRGTPLLTHKERDWRTA